MRGGRMDVQIAELAPEGEMLGRGEVLIPEEDHEIFGERAMDFVHLAVRTRFVRDQLADIDARYFSADDRGELLDGDGLIGFAGVCDVPIARSLLAGKRAHANPPECSSLAAIVARMERSAIRVFVVPALRRD